MARGMWTVFACMREGALWRHVRVVPCCYRGAQVRLLEAERQQALDAAATARAEVEQLQEAQQRLQWQSQLLQKMSEVGDRKAGNTAACCCCLLPLLILT